MPDVRSYAPGRVNLMGDHTDHTGGLVLPLAIDLGTRVDGERRGDVVVVHSDLDGSAAWVPLDGSPLDPEAPEWARLVAAVVAEVRPATGFVGSVTTTLPVGAGLSSSAALEVALALALGFEGSTLDLARLGQRAEQAATGVPCGIMDQLASAAGVAGHVLRIDCHECTVSPTLLPPDLEVVVAHSGVDRALAATPYAERVAELHAAEAVIGPLRLARADALGRLDPRLRRRARHVVTENGRVDAMVTALAADDRPAVSELLRASHASLRDDLEVSRPELDEVVERLDAAPGVLGARLTGAGFGGCAVAVVERGAPVPKGLQAWRVIPSDGACVTSGEADPPSSPGTPSR